MAEERFPDFLPLPPQGYLSDDELPNPIQPALDTLFSEFSQRHRTPSPATRSFSPNAPPPTRASPFDGTKPSVDLRALDYTSDYDSHLMCPICHVPFIDPVVLDCDHTFCGSCLDEYRNGNTSGEKSQCPSCRAYVLSQPKKASRLISNMCNDIKVCCPNEGCITVLARGYMERHILKDCMEQLLHCPDNRCEKQTKRKNFIPHQCIHDTHIECDCGAVIELGRGEWLKHKDEDCPNTSIKCEHCGDRISIRDYLSRETTHDCQSSKEEKQCPGHDFGCLDEVEPEDLQNHITTCPLARLAPFLSRQNRLLHSLSEQLAQSKMRNEVLETEMERINEHLTTQTHSKTNNTQMSELDEIEEIERDHIPEASSFNQHHRELLLPAHIRALTPSPTFSQSQSNTIHHPFHSPATRSTGSTTTSHQHLLSLHDSLRSSITSLETDVHQLHLNITELDARSSMQIMNETLRLKEELSHTSAALFSTRAQVQWLLNKERAGMGMNMMRRQSSIDQTVPIHAHNHSRSHDINATGQPGSDSAAAVSSSSASGGGVNAYNTSNQSSGAASPSFGPTNLDSMRRPSIRRHSGGSQERVKL